MPNPSKGSYKLRALKLSTIAIALVIIVEVSIGLVVNSLAILSDGLHALLDAMAGIMLFVATRAALKPPDEEHTYGHEKFESIGGLIGGIVLVGVALLVIYEAIMKLSQGAGVTEGLEFAGFVAIGYTFATDIVRVAIFRKATGSESTTVKAGFYHAIADLSSTLIAFLGFGLAIVGFNQGDSLASIVLGVLLGYLSIGLIRSNIIELSDTTSKELVQKIRKAILANESIAKCRSLKVRKVGSKIFAEATVQVSNRMSLEEAHKLTTKLEAKLTSMFGNVNATIQIEPSKMEAKMEQLVEKLASIEGVIELHNIATVYVSSKLYVTLHAYVDPKLSVEEAHEIAEKIESKMHGGIQQLENVTVHVEPYGTDAQVKKINKKELEKIVQKVAKDIERNLYIKNVVTYVAEGKRFINMDCCFIKQVSIKKAHEIASRIETEIKEHFVDAVVTVHMEPHCKRN